MSFISGDVSRLVFFSQAYVALAVLGLGLGLFLYLHARAEKGIVPEIPLIRLIEKTEPVKEWAANARELLAKGAKQTDGPFQVLAGTGPIVSQKPSAENISDHIRLFCRIDLRRRSRTYRNSASPRQLPETFSLTFQDLRDSR